ncbi:unnamed protein product [Closterium sp. Yama58-4]|nr:unnamed protein product [Closterium sp. Yama58-4]
MSGNLPLRDSHCHAILVLVASLFALSLAVSQTVAESAFSSQKRLIASGDNQQQQQQHEDGNATTLQAGPGIPIDPSRITRLSWEPRAFLYSGFLSYEECDHLINLARDKVTRSSVADNQSGKSVLSEIRTSSGTFLNKYQDDVVKCIEERIAAWTFLPKEHGEAIQILKYEIGQKYEAHFDYFFDSVNTQIGGHRVATVLMYLTTVEAGGETVFPNAQPKPAMDATASDCANRGLAVKPQKGDALLFYSLHPDGTTDQSSLHASCPVIRGEKWSATKWIHVRSFEARPLAHGCEDLNPKCEEWAALGECKKNPAYMLGDGAYTGNCRKAWLAAVTVGLGPDASQYLDRIVPEVLKSFSDSDSRVRYYACEALYNIAKVMP